MCSCLQCPQLSELVCFPLWELSKSFNIFRRHRVCLVDCGNLICILYSWWEGFGSSSLATLPLSFNYGFISTSGWGSSTGVCSWGCLGGFGFAPVRARCGGGAAVWVAWAPKNWCFWTVVLEKIIESPLDCKEIKPVNSKGNQSWLFIGRMMLKLKL